jgi:AAA ATPase domain
MRPAGRLIGREPVLAAASSVLHDALAGSGQLLLISGEAGIGKSAVLAEVIGQAEKCGALVLRGFCWEGTGVPPYWPWSQVVRASGLQAEELGAAAWLLDDVRRPAESMNAAAAADAQFRLFESVQDVVRSLARDRLVVVVIDDLQWADDPSLRLLGFLVRTLADRAVLVLGAYRDTEASVELQGLTGTAHQLALTGLGPSEVEAMVEAMPGPKPAAQATAQLWQRSGGNPFFVRELTRLLVAQGSWTERDGPGVEAVPAGVAETLRRRLARLSSGCVHLLDHAAVIGRVIDVSLLASSEADEGRILALLDEARQAGVLTGTSPSLRFAHDLYRETILAGLTAATRTAINLSVGQALLARGGNTSAARIAAHLLAGGVEAEREGMEYSILAARESTSRLGHHDARDHYLRALLVMEELGIVTGQVRAHLLAELAATHERIGESGLAMQRYRELALLGRDTGDAVMLAQGALGIQSLGDRAGSGNAELVQLLNQAGQDLAAVHQSLALQSRVHGALARSLRHGAASSADPRVIPAAHRAVELAVESGDTRALALAWLALQDSMWTPGSAPARLPVIDSMLDAAEACGDGDLFAEAHLLRAAALIELGDPTGRSALLAYTAMAAELGHARGRWGALTRQATFAQIAGHTTEAAKLALDGYELGLAIGLPDAVGCFCSLRWSLVALGGAEVDPSVLGGEAAMGMDAADPLWPMFPMFEAWAPAVRGDAAAATTALGDFSVLDIPREHGLEGLAAAAVVFAVAGSQTQRAWTYDQLAPFAGSHVVIGGCASYHAAVDHHLGALAASLGDTKAAEGHLRTALAMHERLGAAGWARLSEAALSELSSRSSQRQRNTFRLHGEYWQVAFGGIEVQLPDAKGLRDLAVLIGASGRDIHVLVLVGQPAAAGTGSDPLLDDRAKAEFKARLTALAAEIEEADEWSDLERAERLRGEEDALLRHLRSATGLGGRARRLGDESERARKTVSARVRDALSKIDHVHPALAAHLRSALRMGTLCSYAPSEPTTWNAT